MMSENERSGGTGPQGTGPKGETPGGGSESRIREKRSDESWKEKAQREKEKLSKEVRQDKRDLPPASFLGLVEELSVRVLLSLGQLPHPATGEVYLDLTNARYTIDLLGVLEEKTRDNLTPEEQEGLQQVLHNLRLAFVHVSRNGPAALGQRPSAEASGPEDSGEEKAGPRIIL